MTPSLVPPRMLALACVIGACGGESRPTAPPPSPPPQYAPNTPPQGYWPPPPQQPPQQQPPQPQPPPQPQRPPQPQQPPQSQDPLTLLLGQLQAAGPPPFALPPGWPAIPAWPPGTATAPQPTGPQPPQPQPPQPQPQRPVPAINPRALDLANTINAYRQQRGLPHVPVTRALTFVAETHVRDLLASPRRPGCNAHSWTDRGPWSSCCYTPDHAQAQCMWRKPQELTSYASTGFEIAIGTPGEATGYVLDSRRALEIWKGSPAHHDVIVNQGTWQSTTWRAMGAGIIDSHAAVWFSKDTDPTP